MATVQIQVLDQLDIVAADTTVDIPDPTDLSALDAAGLVGVLLPGGWRVTYGSPVTVEMTWVGDDRPFAFERVS